jgi:hypothetical protein
MTRLEDADDRATFLKALGKSPKFDPKQHKEMLEQYSNSAEPQVAAVAKELLAKAQ